MVQFNFATGNYYINDEGTKVDTAISSKNIQEAIQTFQNGWTNQEDIERAFEVAYNLEFNQTFVLETLSKTKKSNFPFATATGIVARDIESHLHHAATTKVKEAVEKAYNKHVLLDYNFEEDSYL